MKILMPIDGSECSRDTVRWATEFFSKQDHTQLKFFLVHVVELIPEIPVSDYELEEAIKMLNEAKQILTERGFTVAGSQYVVERPARAICTYADEIGADQIIMGSHGRKGMAKFLVGSVSTEVSELAKQPVLIYNNGPKPSLNISHVDQVKLAETIN